MVWNKSKLRKNDKRRGVYMNEDLTPLRANMSRVLRNALAKISRSFDVLWIIMQHRKKDGFKTRSKHLLFPLG